MRARKKIAAHIQSEVQFFSLKPLLLELKKKYSCVEVVVDDFSGDKLGYREMAKGVNDLLINAGFKPKNIEDLRGVVFDVYLTPYLDGKIKSKCYLKYEYGTLNIKPSLTYTPNMMEGYHGFLCQSTITSELLKVYGATFPVDNLRFYNNKMVDVRKRGNKSRLLFAPTYNDQDDVGELADIIKILKEKYYVVVKGHHGTSYLKENLHKKKVLETMADEYCDSDVSLSELIIKSDVCLFGNSSAIGEALYAKKPCAIFAKDLDYFRIGEMHTTQYYLVKDGFIPWANEIKKLPRVIEMALSGQYREKQGRLSDEIFPKIYRTGIKGYMDVIEYFLCDRTAKDYLILHDYVVEQRNHNLKRIEDEIERAQNENKDLIDKNERLNKENEELKKNNMEMRIRIEDDDKKKLYKIADKIYKIEGRILNGKS